MTVSFCYSTVYNSAFDTPDRRHTNVERSYQYTQLYNVGAHRRGMIIYNPETKWLLLLDLPR